MELTSGVMTRTLSGGPVLSYQSKRCWWIQFSRCCHICFWRTSCLADPHIMMQMIWSALIW